MASGRSLPLELRCDVTSFFGVTRSAAQLSKMTVVGEGAFALTINPSLSIHSLLPLEIRLRR